MGKFKKWLYERYLPAWCRSDLMEANDRLRKRIDTQAREIDRLESYIDGLEQALWRRDRVIIYAGEVTEK